ncbi:MULTISPECIES: COG4315 family predicted lipoprotein [unclassified Pseudomonas]|uniref:COG4315 family predicted lipoprotein n=1 Tax=unclassified Pseudomonas TaxID=196821 RepID=UPI003819BA90
MTQMTASFKALLMAAALTLPGFAMAAEPAMMKDGMMVDHKGMTVYTFDKDAGGKSMCSGDCAKNWPPMMAPAGAKAEGKWTVIKRDDGMMQYAYDGKPLYTFMKDEKPGEMKGDGMKDVWHVVHEHK